MKKKYNKNKKKIRSKNGVKAWLVDTQSNKRINDAIFVFSYFVCNL